MKKILSSVLVCMMLAAMATSCGSDNSGESKDASAAGGDTKVKLEFFQQKDPKAVEPFDAVIEAFQKQNTNVTIEQVNVPDAGQVLSTRIASGDMPDLLTVWPTKGAYRSYVEGEKLYDLTDKGVLDNARPEVVDSIKVNDKVYAMPVAMESGGIIYNKKIFADNGLEIPKKWDDFVALCETLKEKNITPITLSAKDAWVLQQALDQMMAVREPEVIQYFKDMTAGTKKFADNKNLTDAVDKFSQIVNFAQPDSLGYGWEQSMDSFIKGEAAMMLQGTWFIGSLETASGGALDFGMFPWVGDTEEQTKISMGVDCAVSVAKDNKNVDAAIDFVKFLGQPENNKIYCDMAKNISAIKDVTVDIPQIEELSRYSAEGKTYPWLYHSFTADQETDEAVAIQTYFSTSMEASDKESFYKEIDKVFAE